MDSRFIAYGELIEKFILHDKIIFKVKDKLLFESYFDIHEEDDISAIKTRLEIDDKFKDCLLEEIGKDISLEK